MQNIYQAPGSVVQSTRTGYAGFWRRFAAHIIDSLILMVGGAAIGRVIGSVLGTGSGMGAAKALAQIVSVIVVLVAALVLNWLYFTLFEASASQATLGKSALGIVVTDESGQRISLGKANARYWSKIVSSLILMIGFLMAGFTEKKQGLHDMMAGTLVVLK
ncbi:MAG: RDD family protein [Burkholderiaceae bacterium]|nr:RDD family protein [Burkholderiaceae bacterium]